MSRIRVNPNEIDPPEHVKRFRENLVRRGKLRTTSRKAADRFIRCFGGHIFKSEYNGIIGLFGRQVEHDMLYIQYHHYPPGTIGALVLWQGVAEIEEES